MLSDAPAELCSGQIQARRPYLAVPYVTGLESPKVSSNLDATLIAVVEIASSPCVLSDFFTTPPQLAKPPVAAARTLAWPHLAPRARWRARRPVSRDLRLP